MIAMRTVVFAWLASAPSLIHAATIWSGPLIIYNQPSPDPTQASNQDRITPDVWLTRAASKGFFNAFYETNAMTLSPTNTEWALGALTNYAALHYTNWLALLNGASPVTLVGQQMVVHLISEDVYLSMQITFWAAGGSGGFTYQRSTPASASLSGTSIRTGQFTFSYTTSLGFTYVVQSSTNLVNWISLSTNVATGSSGFFTNAANLTGVKFFRVSRLTTP